MKRVANHLHRHRFSDDKSVHILKLSLWPHLTTSKIVLLKWELWSQAMLKEITKPLKLLQTDRYYLLTAAVSCLVLRN